MKLEQSFDVDAPLETVWAALIDVEHVAPCLPGAELTEVGEDGTFHGTFSVKIGPATAAYRGTLKMEEVDEAAHEVKMRASGTDKRGQGGAKALMHSKLSEGPRGGTHVQVETDMQITGRLASFSRGGMIQDVSNRLLGEFASCLQASLRAGMQSAPDETVSTSEAEVAPGSSGIESPPPSMTAAGGERSEPVSAPARSASGPAPQPAKPVNAFRLLLGVLRDRLRRLLRRKS
jgi:carbon monoxide dehydrogenase subunit G